MSFKIAFKGGYLNFKTMTPQPSRHRVTESHAKQQPDAIVFHECGWRYWKYRASLCQRIFRIPTLPVEIFLLFTVAVCYCYAGSMSFYGVKLIAAIVQLKKWRNTYIVGVHSKFGLTRLHESTLCGN